MAEAETARWPERPEECGGLIADRCRALTAKQDNLSRLVLTLRDYRDRQGVCEARIRAATPESDFAAIAACTAGVIILTRAIDQLGPQVAHAEEDYRAVEAAQNRDWSRAACLIRQLTGKQPLENDDRGHRRDRATLTAELQVLIGCGPGPQ